MFTCNEFILKDAEYIKDLEQQQRNAKIKEDMDSRYAAVTDSIDECNIKLSGAGIEKSALNNNTEQLKGKHREINTPGTGQLLDWPLATLEKRYEEIKYKQNQDEKNIGQQIEHFREKKDEAEKSLSKYIHISEQELERVSYDDELLTLLEKDEARNRQMLSDSEYEQAKANEKYIHAKAESDSCGNRLRDEGWSEPLAMHEILGEYDERNDQIDKQIRELELRKKDLDKERESSQRDVNRILRIVENPLDTDAPPPEGGWNAVDIAEQSALYKEIKSGIEKLRDKSLDLEHAIRTDYQEQHSGIDHMLRALSVSQCSREYEACCFTIERLTEQRKLMQETVRVLESHLEHLDNQKENMVFHAYAQGKMLYTELRKISESSRVKLAPDKAPRQTLKIGVPDELDSYAEDRIREYVNACVSDMRREKKDNGLSEKTMRSFIDTRLSDREILNRVIGQHTIDVRLLKVDTSHANTKLRTWESVLTDNSGGELFVSCFVLLSALMDYSRKNILPEDTPGSGVKVMLIDNPFGKTSSTHLLDALIQIAKQFDMQMICLSDLSQSSITSKFSLIYQLSLRPAMYTGKSYLKIDKITSNAPLYVDSMLEHISLRNEQISLF